MLVPRFVKTEAKVTAVIFKKLRFISVLRNQCRHTGCFKSLLQFVIFQSQATQTLNTITPVRDVDD